MVTNSTPTEVTDMQKSADGDTQGSASDGLSWNVRCIRPKGASAPLLQFIEHCESAIQRAVDLLGRRNPSPPPRVADLLPPMASQEPGVGVASTAYLGALSDTAAQRSSLLTMDRQVATTSGVVAAGQHQTLRQIQGDVAELNAKLQAAETGLAAAATRQSRAALESALMAAIGATVQKVCQRVSSTYQMNSQIAGNSNAGQLHSGTPSAGTGAGAPGAAGGGPDIMSSLLPLLAMIPMAASPLLSMVPELLRQHEGSEDKGKQGEPRKPQDPAVRPNTPVSPAETAAPPAVSAATPASGPVAHRADDQRHGADPAVSPS
ncbi:hypothetical protein [Nocardia brasiliensis]|uniref:hypothetical protein n=1 Tax=Nocardia brasiliensis TaxID=37326 RepID=UPI002457961C|nr:hypothetical protein [Nocardia brasiliensis]